MKKDHNCHWYILSDGNIIQTCCKKGSNPERRKMPTIKCPVCKKFLYSVLDPKVKNDCFPFVADDPKYRNLIGNHIVRCPRCHHMIGVFMIDAHVRKQLGIPFQSELHEALTIDQILAYNSIPTMPAVLPSVNMGC